MTSQGQRIFCRMLLLTGAIIAADLPLARANPYPDPRAVAQDPLGFYERARSDARLRHPNRAARDALAPGEAVLRLQLDWDSATDSFAISDIVRENSGTEALALRSRAENPLGSYHGILRDPATRAEIAFDAIGTGQAFRKLTRALTFRFPLPSRPVAFELKGENPVSGEIATLLRATIDPAAARVLLPAAVETRVLKTASAEPKLLVNVYAEGYLAASRARFFEEAMQVPNALRSANYPKLDHMEIRAVWSPSALQLGRASDLGMPIPERDSFLGLYHPYWNNFGRWYHVVYPTRERRYRDALATAPYDYPIALVDSREYWGVGNFNAITAIPSQSGSFSYLLLHEFGHFFGLNEEYEGGGPTELEFAPGIREPWSQNITFLPTALLREVKWGMHVSASTPVPTPNNYWQNLQNPIYGAYKGGYADSEPRGASHIPGFRCMMESGPRFCAICAQGIEAKVRHDLGQ